MNKKTLIDLKKYLTQDEIYLKYHLDKKSARLSLTFVEDKRLYRGRVRYNINDNEIKKLKKWGQDGLVTLTSVKKQFKLNQKEIDKLYSYEVKNPHYSCAAPMRLFFKKQVLFVA